MTKTPKLSKSDAIRQYKAENPESKPKKIVAALTEQGFKINAQFVSTVLMNQRKKIRQNRKLNPEDFNAKELMLIKEIVEQIGDIESARNALDAYESLLNS